MYEQLAPRNDRVQIQFGFHKVTIESIHDSDTIDNLLDLCVRAIRGLGFHFKHPHDEIAEYEKTLARIGEIVDSHIDEDGLLGAASVEDLVRKAIETLLEDIAREQSIVRALKQFEKQQTEEIQDLKQIRDDLQLKVSTQQIGIDAQKARIEELTGEVERLKTCPDPEGFTRWTTRNGSFMWALHHMREGHIVRRLVKEHPDGSKMYSELSRDFPSLVIGREDFGTVGWEIVK